MPIKGYDDKRQITALPAISKSGDVLQPQLIYQGKTVNCHPNITFPDGWDIHHSESHWSTSDTPIRRESYCPVRRRVRDSLDLPLRQRALCIFDVYKAHRGDELISMLGRNGISVVYVPAACTDQLQPLDLIPNNVFKSHLKSEFHNYYSSEVQRQLAAGTDIANVTINMKLSAIKPLHARWLINAIDKLSKQHDMIKRSFTKAGM